jgi:enoyl-CoA hydratase
MRYDEAELSVSHMSYKNIVFELLEDGIATVVMNRPEKLNAISRETMEELDAALSYVQNEPTARALIVTGAGEKAFVAGADIHELAELSPLQASRLSAAGQRTLRRLDLMRKPSIAAVNGFALGAGLELAMACSLRIASPGAKLGLPEVKLGLIPGYGGTQRLPQLVGRGKALELMLAGERIDAEEARRIGLVSEVVPAEMLRERAREILRVILANGPVAIGLAMDAVDVGMNSGLEEALRYESAAFGMAAATEDCKEGAKAFFERRPAVFTGK